MRRTPVPISTPTCYFTLTLVPAMVYHLQLGAGRGGQLHVSSLVTCYPLPVYPLPERVRRVIAAGTSRRLRPGSTLRSPPPRHQSVLIRGVTLPSPQIFSYSGSGVAKALHYQPRGDARALRRTRAPVTYQRPRASRILSWTTGSPLSPIGTHSRRISTA